MTSAHARWKHVRPLVKSERMLRTVFDVPKMDCPSEERIIRLALDGKSGIGNLYFDFANRQLTVEHSHDPNTLLNLLRPLNMGAEFAKNPQSASATETDPVRQAKSLKLLLAINGFMFVLELYLGWIAQSAGLMADSLDMLADASVYGISLYAVGRASSIQVRAGRISGWLQLALALGAIIEVVRRFLYGSEPQSELMMIVAGVALVANVACLFLLAGHRHGPVHMKASWIFSTNDVIANCGVIVAGALVWATKSSWPDLIVGSLIAIVVLRGAVQILKLSRKASAP